MNDQDRMIDDVVGMLTRRFYGKYRGKVVDNADGTRRARLEVQVPAVLGETSVWAMPCVPYAGPGAGLFALPPVGAAVWVEFEAGDVSYPIWTGCFWRDGDIPDADAGPAIKFLRTERISIRIDDDAGTIEIKVADGAALTLSVTALEAKAQTVTTESGTKKTDLTPTSLDVHGGAFSVV